MWEAWAGVRGEVHIACLRLDAAVRPADHQSLPSEEPGVDQTGFDIRLEEDQTGLDTRRQGEDQPEWGSRQEGGRLGFDTLRWEGDQVVVQSSGDGDGAADLDRLSFQEDQGAAVPEAVRNHHHTQVNILDYSLVLLLRSPSGNLEMGIQELQGIPERHQAVDLQAAGIRQSCQDTRST